MTSIIVYGPKACGKTRNASRIRKHFGLRYIEDNGYDYYPRTEEQMAKFKAGNTLYLTNENPPEELMQERRIISFAHVMHEIERKGV